MNKFFTKKFIIIFSLFICTLVATANPVISSMLTPPKLEGPVIVQSHFELYSINAVDDEFETFEFTGRLTLKWHDPRQAFDPASEGVHEKIFQGDYQFNELSPSWYPQIYLVNRFGSYEKKGVMYRIQPDGTSILIETWTATARTKFNMLRFPFDEQHMEAVFAILGFDANEVLLQTRSNRGNSLTNRIKLPQWNITKSYESTGERTVSYDGHQSTISELVVGFDFTRDSFYFQRLVIIPLIIIVLLSFSVFWMDRSSLGDRLNVSFIGILTAVSYQILISDHMPSLSYFTLMNGFLSLSFIIMSSTVIISLYVSSLDGRGKQDVADRLDLRCRWVFPLVYFFLIIFLDSITRMML